MPLDVKIRNLTDKHIKLVQVEHFDPDDKKGFEFRNVTTSFFSVTNSIGLTNSTEYDSSATYEGIFLSIRRCVMYKCTNVAEMDE